MLSDGSLSHGSVLTSLCSKDNDMERRYDPAVVMAALLVESEPPDSHEDDLLLASVLREDRPKVTTYWEKTVPSLSEVQFRNTFRMQRSLFFKVLKVIEPKINNDRHTPGRQCIAPDKKLAAFCRYLGSKDTVFQISQRFDMSASSFVKCRKQVVSAILECLLLTTITWPEPGELPGIAGAICGWGPHPFPGAVGCVDRCRIPIGKPCCEDPGGYGTATKFSVTLQATCREDLRFTDVSVGCSGQMHDLEVFRRSTLYQQGRTLNGVGSYCILGGSAYPSLTWLMTCYPDSEDLSESERRYNATLGSKLRLIQLALGRLRRRFPRLVSGVNLVDLEDVNNVILCACVLHNMCIVERDGEDFGGEQTHLDPDDVDTHPFDVETFESLNEIKAGRQKRFFLTNTLFL